ncbi:methylated-DNA--[protein]-cysteine S-methyltransferase [Nakamurella lactea]|uniref:methylated-DNA--[protein]-cysteine S-methyltransferase n=1 Tax=Nakamurella lactea TaxID=459515 RepID=UPI00040BB88B|nr:methylated-DNA--[protein]-cysteine S-methyltransferase [Nakamurella lactea]
MSNISIASPIGPLSLSAADGHLTGVAFVGNWSPDARGSAVIPSADSEVSGVAGSDSTEPVLAEAARQLAEYFAGSRTEFDLPLAAEGDAFHRGVWQLIAEIPYGETASYGSIALRLGGIRLSQAVGSATGGNPLALVVPCHRVVGSDGSLTGFGGGLDRKRFLLALEESDEIKASRLF